MVVVAAVGAASAAALAQDATHLKPPGMFQFFVFLKKNILTNI